jgi:hypothetical protein
MKIKEFINTPKKLDDTIYSATTSSGQSTRLTQDIVPETVDGTILEQPDHSAIAEGVSQIYRRKKGGQPTKGFRCTSGPRKGRIVAKPSTCFQKLDPMKGAKIRKKRRAKAKIAGVKMARTKRSGPGSRRLQNIQIKKKKGSQPKHGKARTSTARPLLKSKTVKPK